MSFIKEEDYLWNDIPTGFNSGRYHSWAVTPKYFPENLEIIATDKITNTIMAFRHRTLDIRAVQFHPLISQIFGSD